MGDPGKEEILVDADQEFNSKLSYESLVKARSSLSLGSKRTIVTQEILRILLNCDTILPWEVAIGHINHVTDTPPTIIVPYTHTETSRCKVPTQKCPCTIQENANGNDYIH